jgi:hypothetical protein
MALWFSGVVFAARNEARSLAIIERSERPLSALLGHLWALERMTVFHTKRAIHRAPSSR